MALIMLVVALLYVVAPPVEPALPLTLTCAGASLSLFATWFALGRVSDSMVHAVVTAAALAGVGFALGFVGFTGEPSQSVVLVIVLLGTSCVVIHVPAILIVITAGMAGWLAIAWNYDAGVRNHWLINLISSSSLAVLISWARGRTMLQLDAERRDVDRARRALANQAAELEVARDKALDSARTKAEFLAKMSHELRTPLGGIIGLTDLVLESELDDEQRDNVRTARDAAEALLAIIDDLLDIGRLDAGRVPLRVDTVSVRELVAECMRLLEPRAQAKSLSLNEQIADDVPNKVMAEPLMLRRVLVNLIANSVKFTERGGVEVDVACPSPGLLSFSVRDTGIGISRADQKLVWEAFVQADSSARRRFGGVGLGLAISRGLVELMGGSISLESQPGHGTTVRFEVPVEVIEQRASSAAVL